MFPQQHSVWFQRGVAHSLQHVFSNKAEDDNNFWRKCMLIWRKLNLSEEKLKWWQLKTWMVKLNEQKLLKKTVVAVFFFSSLMPWLNRTWFFFVFYLYFLLFFSLSSKRKSKAMVWSHYIIMNYIETNNLCFKNLYLPMGH